MLLKFYKRENAETFYWEASSDEQNIRLYWGQLGQIGETKIIELPEFEPPEAALQREVNKVRSLGFNELLPQDMFELVIQTPIDGMGTPENVETACEIEEVLGQYLRLTGHGYCDGNDIASSIMNVYCYVIDPQLALAGVVNKLTDYGWQNNVVIAYQDKNETFVVLWPPNYKEVFNY